MSMNVTMHSTITTITDITNSATKPDACRGTVTYTHGLEIGTGVSGQGTQPMTSARGERL
jgi:hypothetical protein